MPLLADATPGTPELYDPAGYSGWWAVLGAGLVILAAAIVLVAVLWTRRRAATEEPPAEERPAAAAPRGLRDRYLARVDDLQRRLAAGELDEKSVHLELSDVMRSFTGERLGRDVSTFTLTDVTQTLQAPGLSAVLANNYPPSFADLAHDEQARSVDPVGSLERAREVIRTW